MKKYILWISLIFSTLLFPTNLWVGLDYVPPSQNPVKIFSGKDISWYLLFPVKINFESDSQNAINSNLVYGFSFSTNKIFDIFPTNYRYSNYFFEFIGRTNVFKIENLKFGVNFSTGILLEKFSQIGTHNPNADFGEDGYFHYQNLNLLSLTGSAGLSLNFPITLFNRNAQFSYSIGIRNTLLLLPFKDDYSPYKGNIELEYYNIILTNSLMLGMKF